MILEARLPVEVGTFKVFEFGECVKSLRLHRTVKSPDRQPELTLPCVFFLWPVTIWDAALWVFDAAALTVDNVWSGLFFARLPGYCKEVTYFCPRISI